MVKLGIIALVFVSCLYAGGVSFNLSASTDDAELDMSLNHINIEAQQSLPGFYSSMRIECGAPAPVIDHLLYVEHLSPADAYMTLQISSATHRPPQEIVVEYRKGHKGWGSYAKQIGIAPGSAEFHALKNKAKSHGGKKESHQVREGVSTSVIVNTPGVSVRVANAPENHSGKEHGKKK